MKRKHLQSEDELYCNFLRYHFQPFGLNGAKPRRQAERSDSEARHKAPNIT